MAIKRFPVERVYVYRLFCDRCGEEMVKVNTYPSSPPTNEYHCSKCNMYHQSTIDYPFMKFKVDDLLPKELTEEEMNKIAYNS